MRLWTLHPKYLDSRGLIALWREALLAQAVLKDETLGYTAHPQLIRFRNSPWPLDSIASYLQAVHAEATARGYRFDATKIGPIRHTGRIEVTRGQLDYEWSHLKAKLQARDPSCFLGLEEMSGPEPHPLFRIVPGPVAEWEVMPQHKERAPKRN